jgi:hypothetical protein
MQKLILLFLVLGLAGLDPMLLAQSQGTFAATGNMTTGKYDHTATLLNDGRVLVAGGFGSGFDAQASAELYDPATGTFTATGDMTAARARHRAVLLPDGRVLIDGGQTNIFALLTSEDARMTYYRPNVGPGIGRFNRSTHLAPAYKRRNS